LIVFLNTCEQVSKKEARSCQEKVSMAFNAVVGTCYRSGVLDLMCSLGKDVRFVVLQAADGRVSFLSPSLSIAICYGSVVTSLFLLD
jgi:hypothetical protein